MPYPFTLPTTSPASFAAYYTSPVYPSLPLLTTQHRGTVRNLLKAFKRATPSQQSTQLPQLLTALETYLPYLLFLQSSLHSGDVLPSDSSSTEFTTSWRTTLTSPAFPGAPSKRVQREGLEYEIAFVLSTLAYVHTLLARSQLHDALAPRVTADKKQSLLNSAIQHLLTSSAIFTYSLSLPRSPTSDFPPDLSPAVLSALASLSLADATLLAVTKQDPYPTYLLVSSGQDASSAADLMYAPPAPPTGVKALLLARICIAASSHAEAGTGLLAASSSRRKREDDEVVPELERYLDSLHRVARAKCCRFLGIDAEAAGRVGEGIGWAALGRSFLSSSSSTTSTTGKLKREFLERRESKALERGDASWGLDAGRLEEGRTLERLSDKWTKSNDAVFFQVVEGASTLAARIPSGRDVHTLKPWEPATLDSGEKKALLGRTAVEGLVEGLEGMGWDSEEEDQEEKKERGGSMPGGFVGRAATATPGYY
jgi:hypothetical protein